MATSKTLGRVLSGTSDASIRFDDLCGLLDSLGFDKRINGSHHIFRKAGIEEKINLQRDGINAKARWKQREALSSKARSYCDSEIQIGRDRMSKYEIIIYWSNEDQAFVSEVPELPGCSAHGSTQEAALASAQDAIQLWIETAKEFGDPIPAPKGRRLIFA